MSTAPSSTSLAVARASTVTIPPPSVAAPIAAPATTGASFMPLTVKMAWAGTVNAPSLTV